MKLRTHLLLFCCCLLGSIILLEFTKTTEKKPYASVMLDAAEKTSRAFDAVRDRHRQLDLPLSMESDPNQTGLIGISFSEITTTLGNIESKRSTTNPNTAAMIVDMFYELGLQPGDTVAVNMSGSFPALNIALLCALDSCRLNGVVISSVGASTYGANLPDFTYLDMEHYLSDQGLITNKSCCFSMGGQNDTGDEMLSGVKDSVINRLCSYGYSQISIPDFSENLSYRLHIYDSSGPVMCCVNVGGNQLACGGDEYLSVSAFGILRELPKGSRAAGIIPDYLKRGVPVIQLLNIKNLFPLYRLPIDPSPVPAAGEGSLYSEVRYNPRLLLCLLLLNGSYFLYIFKFGRKNTRYYRLIHQKGTAKVSAASAVLAVHTPAVILLALISVFAAVSTFRNHHVSLSPVSETYKILENTGLENEITILTASEKGPVIFIVGGIHGDETAGWQAALSLSQSAEFKAGQIYLLPAANQYGTDKGKRQMESGEDLNRAFPGRFDGTPAEVNAAAIFREIERIRPDLVIDLHEAHMTTGDGGSGNSLIVTDLSSMTDLLLAFKTENEAGNIGHVSYGFTSPATEGSINRAVSDLLRIPAVTIETMRTGPLNQRVQDQLSIISFFQNSLGMK